MGGIVAIKRLPLCDCLISLLFLDFLGRCVVAFFPRLVVFLDLSMVKSSHVKSSQVRSSHHSTRLAEFPTFILLIGDSEHPGSGHNRAPRVGATGRITLGNTR